MDLTFQNFIQSCIHGNITFINEVIKSIEINNKNKRKPYFLLSHNNNQGLKEAINYKQNEVVDILLKYEDVRKPLLLKNILFTLIDKKDYEFIERILPFIDLYEQNAYITKIIISKDDQILFNMVLPFYKNTIYLHNIAIDVVTLNKINLFNDLLPIIDLNENDKELLLIASSRGFNEIILKMIAKINPSDNYKSLLYACYGNYTKTIDLLYPYFNDKNLKKILNADRLFSKDNGFIYLKNILDNKKQNKKLKKCLKYILKEKSDTEKGKRKI